MYTDTDPDPDPDPDTSMCVCESRTCFQSVWNLFDRLIHALMFE